MSVVNLNCGCSQLMSDSPELAVGRFVSCRKKLGHGVNRIVSFGQLVLPVNPEPDINLLVYWVRKLVHADCGDAAIVALAELSKIERQIPANWPPTNTREIP